MKSKLLKLEEDFKKSIEDPTTSGKYHQMELLYELIDFLEVKLNGNQQYYFKTYLNPFSKTWLYQ